MWKRLTLINLLLFSQAVAKPPAALALSGLPIIYQGYNDCGPASIAMVLAYYGIQVPTTTISLATKPTPTAYMQASQVQIFVAQYGLEATEFLGGQIAHLKDMITLGVPVIALQYFQQVGKVPHFRVVDGFDDRSKTLYLADPLIGQASISYQDFDTLWNTQGRLFVAVYPPALRAKIMRVLGVA